MCFQKYYLFVIYLLAVIHGNLTYSLVDNLGLFRADTISHSIALSIVIIKDIALGLSEFDWGALINALQFRRPQRASEAMVLLKIKLF